MIDISKFPEIAAQLGTYVPEGILWEAMNSGRDIDSVLMEYEYEIEDSGADAPSWLDDWDISDSNKVREAINVTDHYNYNGFHFLTNIILKLTSICKRIVVVTGHQSEVVEGSFYDEINSKINDIIFTDSIPLGATGKILKTKLREQFSDYKIKL